jgi:hypothetical protein
MRSLKWIGQGVTPVFKTGRIMVYQCPTVRPFHMSHSNLRSPWPIHFKFHRVIGIYGLTVCILYGEISIFHSRVMGLYCKTINSNKCAKFEVNLAKGFSIHSATYEKSPTIWWIKSHTSGMENWNFTIKYTGTLFIKL